jgi:hypothetical protein
VVSGIIAFGVGDKDMIAMQWFRFGAGGGEMISMTSREAASHFFTDVDRANSPRRTSQSSSRLRSSIS